MILYEMKLYDRVYPEIFTILSIFGDQISFIRTSPIACALQKYSLSNPNRTRHYFHWFVWHYLMELGSSMICFQSD